MREGEVHTHTHALSSFLTREVLLLIALDPELKPPVSPQHTPCFLSASPPTQVMVTNVTSLLKTVKAVEDEATRGTRALEATIEYMQQELTVRRHWSPPSVPMTHN